MTAIECVVFVAVFAVVCFAFGPRRRSESPLRFVRGLRQLHRYTPAVEVVLDYRSASGTKIVRRVHVTQSQYRRDGRLYLIGFCHYRLAPRTFRVDRVLCFATPDGEVIDTRRFLIDRLAIPPDLCGFAREPMVVNSAA
jgi:predicted DNA-binding transcriptional regulator YafY